MIRPLLRRLGLLPMNLLVKTLIHPFAPGDVVAPDALVHADRYRAAGAVEETDRPVTRHEKQDRPAAPPATLERAAAETADLRGRLASAEGRTARAQADLAAARAEAAEWKQMAEEQEKELKAAHEQIDALRRELATARLGEKTVIAAALPPAA